MIIGTARRMSRAGGRGVARHLSLLLAVALVLAVGAPADGAATPAQRCRAGKNKIAGRYAVCRANAEAKRAAGSSQDTYVEALARCDAKRSSAWLKLEAQAGAGMCPSEGDGTAVRAFLDACLASTEAAFAGGALPLDVTTCNADLATCDMDLAASDAALATCNTDLAASDAALATCNTDLATSDAALSTCDATLATTTTELASCTDDLTATDGALETCTAALTAAEASLSTCTASLASTSASLTTCTTDLSACNASLSTCGTDLATTNAALETCQNAAAVLRFQSTVTAVFSAPAGIAENDTVTFSLTVDPAEATATTPIGNGCIPGATQCDEGAWTLSPPVPYRLAYSSGYAQTGEIDRIEIVDGGVRDIGGITIVLSDTLVLYDGTNDVWEAEAFGGVSYGPNWFSGPIPSDLAAALADVDQEALFELTFYWGDWGTWGTYHYDYITPQDTTTVTRLP